LLKEKSEVESVLADVIQKAKALGHVVHEFLSDNRGEFDNEKVRNILKENGIVQRLTAPYTPEQNGNTEHENRTVVEMARTLMYANKEASFPEEIWGELIKIAVYILNRTGKSKEEWKSPYELWIKKKPRLKHFRIIGAPCYVHIPKQRRTKMDKKAVKGYLASSL
jgi:transposase InsO family protein